MKRNQNSFSSTMLSSMMPASEEFSMFSEGASEFMQSTEGRMTRSRSALKLETLNSAVAAAQPQSQTKETQKLADTTSTTSRSPSGWHMVKMDEDFLGKDCYFHVTIRSKGEQETSFLPENLYSSIKYHIGHKISGSFIKKHNVDHLTVRLSIVDPNSQLEIKQNNKPIVKGVTEAKCSSGNKHGKGSGKRRSTSSSTTSFRSSFDHSEIGTSMKIQLTSCSYHHARAKFAVMASYYRDEQDEEPVMVVISNSFLCFARKPQSKKISDTASVASSVESGDLSSATDDSNSAPSPRLTGHKRKRSNRRSEDTEKVVDGIYVDDGLSDTVRVDRKVVEEYKEMEAKKARHLQLAQTQYPSHSSSFKHFVAKLEDLFETFPKGNDAELTDASSLVVRKLLQLTDNEDQSYIDQKLYLQTQSGATSADDYQPQRSTQSSGMSSFPSSASYSSLLALTEQQFSPFDVTEQLASDDVSSSSQLLYGLSGASDI